MKILLLRHGEPACDSNTPILAKDFSHWLARYQSAGIVENQQIPTLLGQLAHCCSKVVCSQLKRSYTSAYQLNPQAKPEKLALFNEAALPVINIPFLRLRPSHWAVIFRIAWFLGFSKEVESRPAASLRAKEAAYYLTQEAKTHGGVLCIGHGIFNQLVATELIKIGWYSLAQPGRRYWEFAEYTPRTSDHNSHAK